MKMIRSVVLVTIPVSLGAFAMACFDYSSGEPLAAIPGGGGPGPSPSGGSTSTPSGGSGGPPSTATLPCDVLEDAGHPCVSAHSTVRVVVRDYSGPLYQVAQSNGMTRD